MPKIDEKADPIVVAALLEDGQEDEADEEAKKKALDEAAEAEKAEAEEEDESAGESEEDDPDKKKPETKPTPDPKDPKDPKADPKAGEEEDDKKPKTPPAKSGEEDLTDAEKADQEKQTRKERREERRKAFIESLRPKTATSPRAQLLKSDPNYKPLDYDAAEEFKADVLKTDRDKVAQNAFASGAEVERRIAQQEHFWDLVERDEQILRYNPELQFLNPENKEAYDPKRAAPIETMYLNLIGYKEEPLFDPQTRQPLIDPQTQRQQVRATVQRTDLGWKDFVEGYVASMEDWADEESAERSKEIVSQASTQGIRPDGGGKKRSRPQLRPGVFRDMSDEDFEKYDEETDEQILSAF